MLLIILFILFVNNQFGVSLFELILDSAKPNLICSDTQAQVLPIFTLSSSFQTWKFWPLLDINFLIHSTFNFAVMFSEKTISFALFFILNLIQCWWPLKNPEEPKLDGNVTHSSRQSSPPEGNKNKGCKNTRKWEGMDECFAKTKTLRDQSHVSSFEPAVTFHGNQSGYLSFFFGPLSAWNASRERNTNNRV